MWRRTYLALVLLRLYFALSPSYLHPDEHFQGPEVIAGQVFASPAHLTWEFTVNDPIRSVFPLWLVYGWPLIILKWTWEGLGLGPVPSDVVFYTLRSLMFMLSFILEDLALHELLPVPKQRRLATILVSSSYVTWTWQTHTFSNSIETITVLWCLVLIQRIKDDKESSRIPASMALAFLGVFGTFSRITFAAFLVIPLLQLLPHIRAKPLSLLAMVASGLISLLLAISVDTEWYTSGAGTWSSFKGTVVFTPWNNLRYNLATENLAKHGLHPYYQHFVINLPQLLGPAFILLVFKHRRTVQLYSALCGVVVLSCFRHQEARFLLPAIPLILASVDLPKRFLKMWITAWVIFNVLLGTLMGIYHEGGVAPAQMFLSTQEDVAQAFWWKTYSPPEYLLGKQGRRITTWDLMGMPTSNLTDQLSQYVDCGATSSSVLVAPHSALFLDQLLLKDSEDTHLSGLSIEHVWTYHRHLNLNDMEPAEDGLLLTWNRVVGRRGLGIWRVRKQC